MRHNRRKSLTVVAARPDPARTGRQRAGDGNLANGGRATHAAWVHLRLITGRCQAVPCSNPWSTRPSVGSGNKIKSEDFQKNWKTGPEIRLASLKGQYG
jgi:hypothetical protein